MKIAKLISCFPTFQILKHTTPVWLTDLYLLKGGEGRSSLSFQIWGDSTPFQECLLVTKGQAAAIQKTKGFSENRTRELLSHILKFNF